MQVGYWELTVVAAVFKSGIAMSCHQRHQNPCLFSVTPSNFFVLVVELNDQEVGAGLCRLSLLLCPSLYRSIELPVCLPRFLLILLHFLEGLLPCNSSIK